MRLGACGEVVPVVQFCRSRYLAISSGRTGPARTGAAACSAGARRRACSGAAGRRSASRIGATRGTLANRAFPLTKSLPATRVLAGVGNPRARRCRRRGRDPCVRLRVFLAWPGAASAPPARRRPSRARAAHGSVEGRPHATKVPRCRRGAPADQGSNLQTSVARLRIVPRHSPTHGASGRSVDTDPGGEAVRPASPPC